MSSTSKFLVVAPNEIIVNFYYYFSYVTLILCWLIAPFLFYVIITQSKNLTTIKWLILNHSIWCLAVETLLGLVKPLFMMPCAGGIQIGLFKNIGDFRSTAIAALICIVFVTNCIISLTATLGSRYVYVFPSKLTLWLNSKTNFIALIAISFILHSILAITFWPMLNQNTETIHVWAKEYDSNLEQFFKEPSFFMIPHIYLDRVTSIIIALYAFIIISSTLFSIYFISLILKYKNNTSTKLQRSLIISSIMQISLTNIFLNIPFLMFYIFITFDIPNSATAMCICVCIIMSHCLLEFMATLYFISPYRIFVMKFFKRSIVAAKIFNSTTLHPSIVILNNN